MTLQSYGRRTAGGDVVEQEIAELAPWFHNLHLPSGHETAPDHPLGDFPRFKWQALASALPDDLTGWRALDVGCNAGFYTFELARRGATVLGIDMDDHYLRQAKWAAGAVGLEVVSRPGHEVYVCRPGAVPDDVQRELDAVRGRR